MIVVSVQIFIHLVVLRLFVIILIEVHMVSNVQGPSGVDFPLPQEFEPPFVTFSLWDSLSLLPLDAHELQHSEFCMLLCETGNFVLLSNDSAADCL